MTYDEWLRQQNRRWRGKRFRKHLSAADINRLTQKSLDFLEIHGH
jgi:hypothetical protein